MQATLQPRVKATVAADCAAGVIDERNVRVTADARPDGQRPWLQRDERERVATPPLLPLPDERCLDDPEVRPLPLPQLQPLRNTPTLDESSTCRRPSGKMPDSNPLFKNK